MAMEGMTLTGTTTIKDYDEHGTRMIEGFVDGKEVITVHNTGKRWRVGSSRCLPVDIAHARRCLDVMVKVMERTKEG